MIRKNIFLILLLVVVLPACKQSAPKKKQVSRQEMEKIMLEYNKRLNEFVDKEIASFVEHDSLTYQQTSTGLFYALLHSVDGTKGETGKSFGAELTFWGIQNDSLYKIYDPEIVTFAKGKHVLPAINQAVVLMNEGETFRLVVPPKLGFGNDGDRKQIPPARPFVVEITLLKVN